MRRACPRTCRNERGSVHRRAGVARRAGGKGQNWTETKRARLPEYSPTGRDSLNGGRERNVH